MAELCEACEEEVCIRFYEEKEAKEEEEAKRKEARKKYVRKEAKEAKKEDLEEDFSYIVPSSTRVSR